MLNAGAGMDGIYSAGREIREKELFDFAHDWARELFHTAARDFAGKELQNHGETADIILFLPWREFEFYLIAETQVQ